EPYELRGSSTVLREPRGEIPRGYSPNAAIARASRSNRWLNSVFETLIATTRSSRVSRAFHTSPIPPSPIFAMSSYGPSLSPPCSGIFVRSTYYACVLRTSADQPAKDPLRSNLRVG